MIRQVTQNLESSAMTLVNVAYLLQALTLIFNFRPEDNGAAAREANVEVVLA